MKVAKSASIRGSNSNEEKVKEWILLKTCYSV